MEKRIVSKKYKRAFLTGCDEKTEWMLPWVVDNFKKHNDTPMIFADFGVSEEMIDYVNDNFHARMKFKDRSQLRGWFLKPLAMMTSPSIETVWIDTDCEILGDISGILATSRMKNCPWCRTSHGLEERERFGITLEL